jgi:ATP-binding cassette subfamily B protein
MDNKELIKLLLPFLKPYKINIALAVLLMPLGSLVYGVQPTIIQRAVDKALPIADYRELLIYTLALTAAITLHFIIQISQVYLINTTGQKVIADIRLKLFSHLEKLPMTYFDRTPIGRSVTRITSDIEQLSESIAGGLVLVVVDLINIFCIAAFMLRLNWQISLTVFVFLLPMSYLAKYFQTIYREANLLARAELSKLNSFLQQNIVGISVVQLLNSTEKNMKLFADNNHKYFKANDKCIKADAQFSASIELLSLLTLAALIFLSKYLILGTLISIGIIIAFLQYTQSLFEPIRNLSDRFIVIQAGFTAAERIAQLMQEEIPPEDLAGGECPAGSKREPLIEFQNLWFRYNDRDPWVLKDFNLTINAGEKLAIIGRTGSGKSTVVKLLTRLYEAQKGQIVFNGFDIKDIGQKNLREHIAVVHQDSYIFGGDLESNIRLSRDPGKINIALAKPFLEAASLNLRSKLNERATNISAGEEQVINFARAVVTSPSVLVLDEATARIDLHTEVLLQKAFKDFIKDRTAIIIAHRLETIRNVDRIIYLEEGRVAESGSHEGLMTLNGLYAKTIAETNLLWT